MYNFVSKAEGKLKAKITNWVRARYSQIEKVEPVQGMFNQKCFDNAVQYAKSNEGVSIVEVIYIDDGMPILHYLNQLNEAYLETTLGWRAEHLEYYKLRDIPKSDWHRIDVEFNRAMDSWTNQFTNSWHRLIGIKRLV